MRRSNLPSWFALFLLASTLSACGGGGSKAPTPPPPAPTFTVGGAVNGLTGTGLVLVNNGGSPQSITANGPFTFPALASGSTYNVTVQTQPTGPQQTCTVTSGTGTVTANVTIVSVACGPFTGAFPVGATVSGLATGATGLVVSINGGDNKTITANGAFTFDTNVTDGASYDIRVLSDPYDPYQSCTVQGGTGTVAGAAVTAPTIICKTLEPRFATTLDFNDSSYSQYAVDAATGQLRSRGYARVGANPINVGAYADGKISFVLSKGSGSVHAFARNAVTGRLTEAPNSPTATGGVATTTENQGVQALTVHPRLNFIYVAIGGGAPVANSIASFSFNTTTGALTAIPGQPFAAGQLPVKLAIDPSGRFAYAANQTDNTVSAYSIDQTTGALTSLGAAVPAGGVLASSPIVHPNGKWLFVPNVGATASVAAFTIGANGALTAVAGSPFAAPANLTAPLLIHPSGQFIYTKAAPPLGANGTVFGYSIASATGVLMQLAAPITVDPDPKTLWMESSGRYLFTANQGVNLVGSISVLRVNATTGELTKVADTGITPSPYSVSLDWSGKYLYSASAFGNSLRTFAFNLTTGALTPLANGELLSRNSPVTIIPIPSASSEAATFASKFAYVPTVSTINAYSVNATTGAYTARTGIAGPLASGVLDVAVHQSNGAVLAVDEIGANTLKTYPMNATNGNLSASTDSVAAGNLPNGVAVDPSGRFAYVPDALATTLRVFDWDAADGDLTVGSTSGTTNQPFAVAMHPTGRFLFYISDARTGYRAISPTNGALSTIGSSESVSGTIGQQAIAAHPNGRYVYVARAGTPGHIDGYLVTPAGSTAGELSAGTDVATVGNDPRSIAIDPTGRFMYVAQRTPFRVLAFSIAANGALTPVDTLTLSGAATVVARVDYNGKLLHVIDGNQLRSFAIDQNTGALTITGATPAAVITPNNLALSEDVE